MIEGVADVDDDARRSCSSPTKTVTDRASCKAAIRRATIALKMTPGDRAARPTRTRACSCCSTRVARLPPEPERGRQRGARPEEQRGEGRPRVDPGQAVRRPGVQARGRPLRPAHLHAHLPGHGSPRATSSSTSRNQKKVKVPRIVRMHSQRDERHRPRPAPGDIVALFGVECASGDTFTDGRAVKYTMTSMHVPDAVIYARRGAEGAQRAGQLLQGAQPVHQGGPDLPRAPRRGVRPDHHRGHGRAAPRDLHRAHEARVQLRGGGRQAAGGLPRDHHPARPSSPTPTRSRPVAPASSPASCGYIEPLPADAVEHLRVRRRHRRRRHPPRVHPRRATRASSEAHQEGLADRLPGGGRARGHQRRRIPRGRLVRAGVQDRGDHGLPRGLRGGQADHPRADHEGRGAGARGVPGLGRRPAQPAPRHHPRAPRTPRAT